METINNNLSNYSKIDILDMCNFLNGKADLTTNNYLKRFDPFDISKVEMYEYIKFKTDNFDKIKFQLVFDEISYYSFNMDFYRLAKVDGKILNKYVTDYEVDYNFTDKEPYEYICKTLELNKGLIVNCQQVIEFIKLAEELYQTVCENKPIDTPPPTAKQFNTNFTDVQRGILFDLLVKYEYIPDQNKEGFIWAFGGEKKPASFNQIKWIDKSTTRHETNVQTLFELLFLLGVDKNTDANNPDNIYRKIEFCFEPLNNITVKNPTKTTQNTERKKLLSKIIEEVKKEGA